MRAARGILMATGVALLGVGGFVLLTEVRPTQWLGIAVWVGAAILIHDGVVAPLAVAVGLGAERVRRPFGRRGVAIAQGALVVGGMLTALTLPALLASLRGTPNPTLLVGSYGLALGVIWLVLAAVAAIALRVSRTAVRRAEGTTQTK
ncbi:hypothetical protein [Agromyces sp. SYSU T0242]|uniref:hypothetical protein n=1 Tax=Agromyces litoreus TaxID=3158561 RepID=UPI0033996CCC